MKVDLCRQRKQLHSSWIFLEGNHENRIKKAIEIQPELEGAVSFSDLQLEDYYDDIVEYTGGTPGVIDVEGCSFAHYFISGNMGRPISGEHPAASLIAKQYGSCSAGHSHLADYSMRTDNSGKKLHGLVGGCFFDYDSDWAGRSNRLYWRGCVIKRNVSDGDYSPQFVSMKELKRNYG